MADASAMTGVVKLVCKTFLEKEHYHQLFRLLSQQWSACHSLTAAVRLMEAYGVKVTAEEEARFAAMDEGRMIDNLIMRMPQQSREQFEHFFLQLSFIASTTTRLRQSIEAGDLVGTEEAMDGADSMGVLAYLMKMAVAQSGAQVKNTELEQDNWMTKTDNIVAPLLQAQAQMMTTQHALAEAKGQIDGFRADAKGKSATMLAKMTTGNEKALLTAVVSGWMEAIKNDKLEREILAEYGYEEQIDKAEKQLFAMKSKALEAARATLSRAAARADGQKIDALFRVFKTNTEEKRRNYEQEGNLKALEAKLAATASNAASNAKKTMARLGSGKDDDLLAMTLKAWRCFVEEYNKDKAMNDAIKAAEQKVKNFQNQHKEGSQNVMQRMCAANDAGLKASSFQAWRDLIVELAEKTAMEEKLNSAGGNMKSFSTRNKQSAQSINKRVAILLDVETFIFFFSFWKREVKVDLMRRYGEKKVRDQKDSLVKVKGAVRGFATDLETTLKSGTPPTTSRQAQ